MSGQLDNIARAPLFDRLTDLDPRASVEPRPLRTLTYKELLASVRREVEDLLNTRCPFPAYEVEGRPRSTIDYGVPDFSGLSPQSREDQKQVARHIAAAIEVFEPRLRDVYVEVERYDPGDGALHLQIHALLLLDRVTEPISFPLAVSAAGVR
jgi:type VI secretion system protein ImpF